MAKAPKNLQRGKGLGAYLGAPTKTISKGAAYGAAAGAAAGGLAKAAGKIAGRQAMAMKAAKPSFSKQVDRLIKRVESSRINKTYKGKY